jgi:biopolymer transport protein ExbB
MWEFIQQGGPLMLIILGCSILALGIILEKAWYLQNQKVSPKSLRINLLHALQHQHLNQPYLHSLARQGPLGKILAKGVQALPDGPEQMQRRMEEWGRYVIIELERYLNSLGTIALITPLLGLLGTVVGMIQVFMVLTLNASPDPEALSGGIAKALLTTAFGLGVAIPSLIFHRYFQRRIDELTTLLEQESAQFIEDISKSNNFNKNQD